MFAYLCLCDFYAFCALLCVKQKRQHFYAHKKHLRGRKSLFMLFVLFMLFMCIKTSKRRKVACLHFVLFWTFYAHKKHLRERKLLVLRFYPVSLPHHVCRKTNTTSCYIFIFTFGKGQKFSNFFLFLSQKFVSYFLWQFHPSQLKHHLYCLTFLWLSKWHHLPKRYVIDTLFLCCFDIMT